MSSQSIALYEDHLRTTRPPPPPEHPAAEWEAEARRCHVISSRYLAKALEAEAMAALLRGKPRADTEFDRRVAEINSDPEAAHVR